jgi:ABC-type transporter Mla subunit MlaD
MGDDELASAYRTSVPNMPDEACGAFVEAIFDAFRDRGESSEDVVEEAGTTLERVATRETDAISALLEYAAGSPGLLKETSAVFVEHRPDLVHVLPRALYDAIAQRLSPNT